MSRWKVIVFVTAIVLLLIGGTVWNYIGFKENSDQQQVEKKLETVYTSDADKPDAGEIRRERDPKLELTQDLVELEIGAIFNSIDYIKVAEDIYGYSVKEKVVVDKTIPTDVPGTYEVIYTMKYDENEITKILRVEIKEMY